MSNRFNIDDEVYLSAFNREAITVKCPDCFGTLQLRVILGDGTEIFIDCVGCASGYERPKGYIINYKWTATAKRRVVTRVTEKQEEGKIKYEYHFAGGWYDSDGKTFATKEEAIAKADELKQSYEEEENRRMMAKTKDKMSWAWNVSYHRQCAARAQKELEYHQAKARVCLAKSKIQEEKK